MKLKFLLMFCIILMLNSCSDLRYATNKAELERVNSDLIKITKTGTFRNYQNQVALNSIANYIYSEFEKVSDTVYFQEFKVQNSIYKNVVASIGRSNGKRLIIGAHYDVCGNQEGADDNASGIAGLLELARLLSKENLDFRVDFVAYTLEEPPFYRSKNMGSYVHAKWLKDNNIEIMGMICLEMIGYYNDSSGSQDYPIGVLKWFYGDKGNFITVVQNFNNGRFGNQVKELMTKQKLLPTKSFTGPKKLTGIDFSDHRNYWKFGYNAVMITNTAFYRNKNYHEVSDTLETLDLNSMCLLIDEVCNCILNL